MTPSSIASYLADHGPLAIGCGYGSLNDRAVVDAARLSMVGLSIDAPPLPYRFETYGTTSQLELVPTVGMGATCHGWSDCHPYEVVRIVNRNTLDVRPMHAEGGLKPDAVVSVGGFSAHVHDQSSAQAWALTPNPSASVVRIYRTKQGQWTRKGQRFTVGKATKFHDYNF